MLPVELNKNDSAKIMQSDSANRFVCRRCGKCCREPGYVYLTAADVDRIAAFLAMDVHVFTAQYTRLPPERRGLSLNEKDDRSCVFLDAQGRCAIQAVKPAQCAAFPHGWKYKEMQGVCEGWKALGGTGSTPSAAL